MKGITPEQEDLARRLFEHGRGARRGTEARVEVVQQICQKLFLYLDTVVTTAAVLLLFNRALKVARDQYPLLERVEIGNHGRLVGLHDAVAEQDLDLLIEVLVAVIAAFIGTLATFLGQPLVLRLVREIWPMMPPGEHG